MHYNDDNNNNQQLAIQRQSYMNTFTYFDIKEWVKDFFKSASDEVVTHAVLYLHKTYGILTMLNVHSN